jgi:tetratricopeptide (TPR) repeat protein
VEAALPLVRAAGEPHLTLKASLAQGRTHNRRDEYRQAIEVLEPLVEKAIAMGEPETAAIGLVLLGFALAHLDLERSEACFERAIAFCKRTGDDFHLGIAYSNRVMLWIRRGSAELAAADLRLALLKARELGYPQIERFASFNLAECLYWQDRAQEALPFAQRAHDLGLRFFSDRATALDALLVARIACSLGQYEEARQHVEWIERHSSRENFSAGANALYQSTRLLAHHGIQAPLHLTEVEWNAWKSLAASAPLSVPSEEWAEVLGAAGRVAAAAGHQTEARAWACQARPRRQS